MTFFKQLGLMLWKNWVLQKRRKCSTIFQIVLPILVALIILLTRALMPGVMNTKELTLYKPDSLILSPSRFNKSHEIGFSPRNSETEKVMEIVEALIYKYRFQVRQSDNKSSSEVTTAATNGSTTGTTSKTKTNTTKSSNKVKGFNDEETALKYCVDHPDTMQHLITFYDVDSKSSSLPNHVKFAVRPKTGSIDWMTDRNAPKYLTMSPRGNLSPPYESRGVLYLQFLMGVALTEYRVKQLGGNATDVQIEAYKQRFPYPPYYVDFMIELLQKLFPTLLKLVLILSVVTNTKTLVAEKEKKLKESMKLMGLRGTVYWASWFITFMLYFVPVMLVFTLIFGLDIVGNGPVLAKTEMGLFYVFLLCYCVATTSLCFMLSTFVQKATLGAVLACMVFLFSDLIKNFMPEYIGRIAKLASMLISNVAMNFGCGAIGAYEGVGEGAQWSNFYKPASIDDDLSLLDCMLMLMLDSVLYLTVAWYLDNIYPGEFGVPKPKLFCLKKSYWLGEKVYTGEQYMEQEQRSKYFEKQPTDMKAGIEIKNLKKIFDQHVAVAGTTLNMYEGQITALLGHNGAGKTTTISMLTGFFSPTSGTALISGYDIRKNMAGVRSSLGLCPQHNVLFDVMTVREHLQLFAKLKGTTGPGLYQEVVKIAKDVGLGEKFNERTGTLSGGQKRKLSVGIALIGGSKVVILDEPSSGMDPGARRRLWNVLQNAREGRTIVLSTHYMDEADYLGDRIAIMHEGVVKCCGSSMFLKKLYGTGYHLVIVKDENCDVDAITQVVNSHLAKAKLESVINKEITYFLRASESGKFVALFRELEEQKEQLKILNFGTSVTTMEEVFLKVGQNHEEEEDGKDTGMNSQSSILSDLNDNGKGISAISSRPPSADINRNNSMNEKQDIMSFNKGFAKKTGLSLALSRMRGVFVKKAINTWRSKVMTLCQLLLPILPVLFISIQLSKDVFGFKDLKQKPELKLNLDPWDGTEIPYTSGRTSDERYEKFADYFQRQFSKPDATLKFDISDGSYEKQLSDKISEMSVTDYRNKLLVGMKVKPKSNSSSPVISATALYNGEALHMQPIAVNFLMNTFLQYYTNGKYSMESSVHPMPKDDNGIAKAHSKLTDKESEIILLTLFLALPFIAAYFMYFPIKEREIGAKHMQTVSGAGPFVFWIPTFLWDYVIFMIPCSIIVVTFLVCGLPAYVDGCFALVTVFALYGWAQLPVMYAIQYKFKSAVAGVTVFIVVSMFIQSIASLIIQIVKMISQKKGEALDNVVNFLIADRNLRTCLDKMLENYRNADYCKPRMDNCLDDIPTRDPCCPKWCENQPEPCKKFTTSYLSYESPGIGVNLILLAVLGASAMILVFMIEYHVSRKICSLFETAGWPNIRSDDEYIDSDVAAERERVLATDPDVLSTTTDPLLLVKLYKEYGMHVVVDDICVGVAEQECFGLLGLNGAGKTSIFNMLTGAVPVTKGNAYLKGFDIRRHLSTVQANLGYCPQFDALLDNMTGRETLTMYARLRGVPQEDIKTVADTLFEILILTPHADKLVGNYSGGNKRKLSTAVALIGDPPFIMLDEPSCGMDPGARRQLWNVLAQVRASGRTLVLTSHSMEECDALCTRIAIMVNGIFLCLGSPQQLKNKFGQGYTLVVKLAVLENGEHAPNEPVTNYVLTSFPDTEVFDDHEGYMHFKVNNPEVHIADVFEVMEASKANLYVEDYSVHQTSLEQVFLAMTRGQFAAVENKAKSCAFCCD